MGRGTGQQKKAKVRKQRDILKSIMERMVGMVCIKGYEVKVLSANSYYIGTLSNDGMPMCRLSADYFRTKAEAQKALDSNSFTCRNGVEIEFCSQDKPCFHYANASDLGKEYKSEKGVPQ